jgi:uncharacterized protein (DUF1697 family)
MDLRGPLKVGEPKRGFSGNAETDGNSMSTFIALLRGINVGGNKLLAMSDLRTLAGELGFEAATTWLQSGNLVFKTPGKSAGSGLEDRLERETAKRLGVSADYIVRSPGELAQVVAANPFPKEAKDDPSHLLVMFLKTAVPAKSVAALQESVTGPETIRGSGKHLYIVYPAGMGTSKLTGAVIEKRLGTRGTARNWNTTLKLLALSREI